MKNIKIEGNSVLLCCGKGKCPALTKDVQEEGMFSLTDDFGGKVKLNKDQLLAIQEAVEASEKIND